MEVSIWALSLPNVLCGSLLPCSSASRESPLIMAWTLVSSVTVLGFIHQELVHWQSFASTPVGLVSYISSVYLVLIRLEDAWSSVVEILSADS